MLAANAVPAPLRVILFASRRSGSTYLVDLLRSDPHQRVLMHGELFHVTDLKDPIDGYAGRGEHPSEDAFEFRRKNPLAMLDFISCHSEGRPAVGFKMFHDHTRPEKWALMASWCDVCVVLARKDQPAQFRSYSIARRTGRWKGRSNWSSLPAVAMPAADNVTYVSDFAHWKRTQKAWYRRLDELLAQRRNATIVHLNYERHLLSRRPPNLTALWQALASQEKAPASARCATHRV